MRVRRLTRLVEVVGFSNLAHILSVVKLVDDEKDDSECSVTFKKK
jgi:hypothetical protein